MCDRTVEAAPEGHNVEPVATGRAAVPQSGCRSSHVRIWLSIVPETGTIDNQIRERVPTRRDGHRNTAFRSMQP